MEIIIGLLVLAGIGYVVFFRKKEEAVVIEAVPYKVETPAPVVQEAVVETVKAEAVAEAPAKKPRKPRAPKAEAVVVKKPAAKKAAVKKPAARTAKPKAVSKKA